MLFYCFVDVEISLRITFMGLITYASFFSPIVNFPKEKRMSWNQTPPPMSPRRPKIQQQSWEGTPTVNLYEPTREFYDSSPNMPVASASILHQTVKKSPANQGRKINYNKYCLPNPMHQLSDPGTYNNMMPNSQKSPSSPAKAFDFELSVTPQHHSRTPQKSVASNRRCYEDTSTSDLTPTSLMSPRKLEFGAVSPKFDYPGTNAFKWNEKKERCWYFYFYSPDGWGEKRLNHSELFCFVHRIKEIWILRSNNTAWDWKPETREQGFRSWNGRATQYE